MLWWIVQNFVVTAVLAACIALAVRIGRIGPVAQHVLWLLLLLKLLTPPLVIWPWMIPNLFSQFNAPRRETPAAAFVATSPMAAPAIHDGVTATQHVDPPRSTERPQALNTFRQQSFVSWLPAITALWIAGGLTFILLQAERIRRMLQRTRTAVAAPNMLASHVSEVARRLGVKPVETRLVAGIGSPLIWCIPHAMLLWPAELSNDLPEASVRALIAHEMAHVRRRDHWVGWLELVGGCLWWWNPIYWCIRHRLRENAELSCDAWVIDIMASIPQGRRAYADGLLAVCECISGQSKQIRPLSVVGVDSGNRRFLERRLTMILRQRFPLRLPRVGILIVALLGAGMFPVWSLRGAEQNPAPPSSSQNVTPASPRTSTPPPAASPTSPSLPNDAQALVKEFETRQAEARRTMEASLDEQRRRLLEQLQGLQDSYTRAGRLDEAVAIRDHVRRLQGRPPAPNDSAELLLDRNVPQVNFTNTGLKKVLDALRDSTGANIFVHWKALHELNVNEDMPVNVRVRNVPLRRVLSLILTDVTGGDTLTYDVQDGVIEITSKDTVGARSRDRKFQARLADAPILPAPPDLMGLRNQVGNTFKIRVTGSVQGRIWGTDVYTDDTHPGTAAVHAGLLQPGEDGVLLVTILPGQGAYQGSTRNRVSSQSFAAFPGSYRFEGVERTGSAPVDQRNPPQTAPEAIPRLSFLRDRVGQTLEFE